MFAVGRRRLAAAVAAQEGRLEIRQGFAVACQQPNKKSSAAHDGPDPLAAEKAKLKAACEARNGKPLHWVFLGAPGVGKGTYVSRLSKIMGVPHISAGDLVRDEIKRGSPLAKEMEATTKAGKLLPDEIVLRLLKERLDQGKRSGEPGCLLDGFPRTRHQAELLSETLDVHQAVNFSLREHILILKCCGRRVCRECGGNYNTARIDFPATATEPAIFMPPLDPPPQCAGKMEVRPDDTEEVVKRRLEVYKAQCGPVEEFYREKGLLFEFPILAGIPETLPRLLPAAAGLLEQGNKGGR